MRRAFAGGRAGLRLSAALVVLAAAVEPSASQAVETAQAVQTLDVGAPVEREIRPGDVHAYALHLDAHRFAVVDVEQRGVDVEVRVLGPRGDLLDRFDAPVGPHGPDPVVLSTEAAGAYRIEVRLSPRGTGGTPRGGELGPYAIRLVEIEAVAGTPEGRVDQLLTAWDDPDAPGEVVAVVKGGRVVFSRGLGLAALEHRLPITPETVFDIGSIAKEFTDFAVVLLAQQGRLSLEDDIRKYLPESPDFGWPIRIRNLIHHTSGIREIYSAAAMTGWRNGDGIFQEDALRLVTHLRELNFEPGTEYLYCNTAYMLLADIVARVSGRSFPEFMEENVFGPLGMSHTTIMDRQGEVIPNAAHSYAPDGSGGWVHVFDNSSIQGAGGIYTTVEDLARWIGNFADPRVGGPEAVRQMQERGVLANGDTLGYAFGLQIGEERGLRIIGHGGSSAGYRAYLAYYPEPDVGIIVLSNSAAVEGSLGIRVGGAYLAEEMEPRAPLTLPERRERGAEESWEPTPEQLQAYAGAYHSPELGTVYTLTVKDGVLRGWHGRHGAFELRPVEPDEFRGPSWFPQVRFHRDGGWVTGLRVTDGRIRNMWFERQGR